MITEGIAESQRAGDEQGMRLLDLCAGELGWASAFARRGHTCVCVDLRKPMRDVPSGIEFWQRNILSIDLVELLDACGTKYFDFIVASTPCEEFSTLRNFRPPAPYPTMGVKLFNHARSICEASGIPYVLENVAGAQRFVGRSNLHCGAYHLWGNGIPPLIPKGISKGLTELAMGLREHKGKPGWNDRHGSKGQTPTALVATIPPELANCVAEYAERILEQNHAAQELR